MHGRGFPDGSNSKGSDCNTGDPGLIPELGRSSGEGNGYPLQYSHLENSMDRGAWRATVHSMESDTTEQLALSLFMHVRPSHLNISESAFFASIHGIDFFGSYIFSFG